MSAARAPRRSARDAAAATATGSASASARGARATGGSSTGSAPAAGTGAGRERAIEQLIDADPRGPHYRASRIMVSYGFELIEVVLGCHCMALSILITARGSIIG